MTRTRPGGPGQRGHVVELGALDYVLPASGPVVALARRMARAASRHWPDAGSRDSVLLILSELLGNAVKAAVGPTISLRLSWTARRVRIEVADDNPQLPSSRQPALTDEGGRGLFLVDQLATRWGSHRVGKGKCVWAEVALPAL